MTTQEIADRLVAYCRQGNWNGAHEELYALNARSIEPYETPEFPKTTDGIDKIMAKARMFEAMVEKVHSLEVSEPLVAGNSISFKMAMDLTMKDKTRMNSPEICVYQVKDGKIISEEFFV